MRREIQMRDEKINRLEQENKSLLSQTQQMKSSLNSATDLRARISDTRQEADRRIAETLAQLEDYKAKVANMEAYSKAQLEVLSARLESQAHSEGGSSRASRELEEEYPFTR